MAGSTSALLEAMLQASNWMVPNSAIISLLDQSARLSKASVASLAPESDGLNIEGLAALPTSARPNQLLIGFRNPQSSTKAIVVSLVNPDAVVTGTTASFGEAFELDLGGLGIRALSWSAAHQKVLVLAGPHGGGGPFRLYTWDAKAPPVPVQDVAAPKDGSPEAIVTYPNTRDVQILFDQGDNDINGEICKDASDASKFFTDVIVHVD